jgi:hypothetical protein
MEGSLTIYRAIAAALLALLAQNPAQAADIAPKTVREDMFPKLTAHFPGGVVALPDIDHGFLGPTPAAIRDASLLALRRSFDFIDRIAGGKGR